MKLFNLEISYGSYLIFVDFNNISFVEDNSFGKKWAVNYKRLKFASFSAYVHPALIFKLNKVRPHLSKIFSQMLFVEAVRSHFDKDCVEGPRYHFQKKFRLGSLPEVSQRNES